MAHAELIDFLRAAFFDVLARRAGRGPRALRGAILDALRAYVSGEARSGAAAVADGPGAHVRGVRLRGDVPGAHLRGDVPGAQLRDATPAVVRACSRSAT